MSNEPATINAVTAALQSNDRISTGRVCHNLDGLILLLEQAPASAAVVDIDPRPKQMLSELDRIISRFADTRFIVLSSDMRSELILEAMQIGVRHFLTRQAVAADLANVLQRILPRDTPRTGRLGTMVTVLSAGGGCGATTLAINLANELALAGSGRSLLLDMDCHYGAIATYLSLEGRYGLADVLSHKGRIDPELIHTTTLSYSEKLHALLSPASILLADPAPLRPERMEEVYEACRWAYPFVIADAPRVPMDMAAGLARASRQTLLAFQLTVKDLRMARIMLSALLDKGVAMDTVLAVANRCNKSSSLVPLEEARRVLKDVSIATLTNDFRAAFGGTNYGEPLAQGSPRSSLRQDITRLATAVLQSEEKEAHTPLPSRT